ncbi:hypothetical protein NBEOAGPD_1285 [Methylobacterium gregans]|uniref:Uncharacterized protein n=1 Tax=Methylobacterium gregans TaxID=374424 RepID=A0AA37HMV1_9HYPH|nr:hypothetical protein [Methylobacterium gregans]GJD78073.1 hypothetical protein NBEOAGPD_1285 [Methylobacterium gregans]
MSSRLREHAEAHQFNQLLRSASDPDRNPPVGSDDAPSTAMRHDGGVTQTKSRLARHDASRAPSHARHHPSVSATGPEQRFYQLILTCTCL